MCFAPFHTSTTPFFIFSFPIPPFSQSLFHTLCMKTLRKLKVWLWRVTEEFICSSVTRRVKNWGGGQRRCTCTLEMRQSVLVCV